ncbi:MAG: hypothetical protein ACI4UK_08255 [Floccifex sp.]
MLSTDKDALLCDLAETYGIYDIKELPLSKVALFSVGLRADSRIKMLINSYKFDSKEILLASIADRLGILISKMIGAKIPDLILDKMISGNNEKDYVVFSSIDEFEKERNRILGGETTCHRVQ